MRESSGGVMLIGLAIACCIVILSFVLEVKEPKFQRTCPKTSPDGHALAYSTYSGDKLTCTYIPHTKGLVRFNIET